MTGIGEERAMVRGELPKPGTEKLWLKEVGGGGGGGRGEEEGRAAVA